jgi:hypothetical protein
VQPTRLRDAGFNFGSREETKTVTPRHEPSLWWEGGRSFEEQANRGGGGGVFGWVLVAHGAHAPAQALRAARSYFPLSVLAKACHA